MYINEKVNNCKYLTLPNTNLFVDLTNVNQTTDNPSPETTHEGYFKLLVLSKFIYDLNSLYILISILAFFLLLTMYTQIFYCKNVSFIFQFNKGLIGTYNLTKSNAINISF